MTLHNILIYRYIHPNLISSAIGKCVQSSVISVHLTLDLVQTVVQYARVQMSRQGTLRIVWIGNILAHLLTFVCGLSRQIST